MSPRKIHADQADIDTPLVRELVAAQFPQWAGLPLEPVDSSGLVNAIYRLGSDLSVRLPLRPSITDEVQREQAKLAALAPFLPVAIPSVEAIGSPTDAFPGEWSVHRWLTGTHPSPDALADPRRLATDLAAFVDAFRRIDLPDRPPAYPGERRTRAPMDSMDSPTRKAIGELDGLIDTRAALASWEESLAAPYDGREVWVHSDLTPSNLLVSAEGRLTAVIDFETCGVGDPACDLFPVWHAAARARPRRVPCGAGRGRRDVAPRTRARAVPGPDRVAVLQGHQPGARELRAARHPRGARSSSM